MWTYVAIAIGGTLGCWARYAQTSWVQTAFGRDFPFATMSINVIGSFLMGFLFIVTLERLMIPPSVRAGVLTGVLGGYTTFSTFEMETLLLAESGEFFKAASYVILSVVIGFAAAFGGAYVARNL
ncbi:MAG TPA: fluoride efflux transporter CrcB [Roseiarcus sp.]|jgi:fluoride exporter|nr:fluoride efflux transporter CrcB [Roseiarcus sp.]